MPDKITVKEMWWEGSNLHIISDEGKHLIFENAYYSKCETVLEGESVKSEPLTFVQDALAGIKAYLEEFK